MKQKDKNQDLKKNPELKIISVCDQKLYVSDFSSFFTGTIIPQEKNPKLIYSSRKFFNNLPIYLKHTIFHNDEDTKKLRFLGLSERSFIWDNYKNYGNKAYHKGDYKKSIFFYERALSCLKWVSVLYQEKNIEKVDISNFDYDYEDTSYQNLEHSKPFLSFTDENIKIFDGEELKNQTDKENRNSLLILTYLNLCSAYLQLSFFEEAKHAVNDALALSDKNSLVFFRKSQVYSCNNEANLNELEIAKNDISKAIEIKRFEDRVIDKKNNSVSIEIYYEQSKLIDILINKKIENEKTLITNLLMQKNFNSEENEIKFNFSFKKIRIKYIKYIEDLIVQKLDKEIVNAHKEFFRIYQLFNKLDFINSLNLSKIINYFPDITNNIFISDLKEKLSNCKENEIYFINKEILKTAKSINLKTKTKRNFIIFNKRIYNMEIFVKLTIIIIMLCLFYYINKDKSLFKKLLLKKD